MLKNNTASPQYEIEMISLEQLVPKDHLVRKVAKAIDFEFIRDEVAHLYCHDNGRPAVDPIRLFKIMLLGYLFGIKSERQLVKEIEVNVAYRWFLGMSLTEKVIDASTLSQNRLRRFNGTDVFERIFTHIVWQAMEKGLVGGKYLFTDSTHLKASANKNKKHNEKREVRVSQYIAMLNEDVAKVREAKGKKPLKASEKAVEVKDTNVSNTDTESGYMHRDNKPKGFFYLDHRTVDGQCGIILDTFATAGMSMTANPISLVLMRPQNAFGSSPKRLVLMQGILPPLLPKALLDEALLVYLVIVAPTKGKNCLRKSAFHYNAETDSYTCPAGQSLSYSTTTREGYHTYKSNPTYCQTCPIRSQCTQNQKAERLITRHIYQDAVDNANAVRVSRQGRKLYQRRAETVERSFADAKQHHGHRYARYRGLSKVQMQCFLAAMAQNIKKIALVVWAILSYLWRQFYLFEAGVKQSAKMTAGTII
ncbi:putative transposase [Gallibacterium anatis UMN179]|uniref:Putative transposase n=7 Tax=Gallibacterium anatis TaxID=750 RepID=F4HCK1_GALAU|nr:IS1182 family transposase [Gallibacterium anatis]AEC17689.1 putative transposase [Gallibacterium anatis UMN179]